MKKFRAPRAKDGELKLQWGKLRYDNPDICVVWGNGCHKADSRLIMHTFCSKNADPHTMPIFSKMNPSLVEELEKRGYDITTLKFSIKKKVVGL
jgi:hypothetical protein